MDYVKINMDLNIYVGNGLFFVFSNFFNLVY